MQIKNTNLTYTPNFGAKFLKTELLQEAAEYALKNNKFSKLNEARKIIENHDVFTRISVDIKPNAKNTGKNFVFTAYIPKYNTKTDGEINKHFKKSTTLVPSNKTNYLQELCDLIIKMSRNSTENNFYKKVVKGI